MVFLQIEVKTQLLLDESFSLFTGHAYLFYIDTNNYNLIVK